MFGLIYGLEMKDFQRIIEFFHIHAIIWMPFQSEEVHVSTLKAVRLDS